MTDTSKQLNKLDLIKTNLDTATKRDIPSDSLILVQQDMVGGKILESCEDGSFKEAETVTMKVTFSSGETQDFYIKG